MYASRFLFNKRGVLPPRDKIAHFQRFIYLIDLDCYKPCKGEIYTAMGIAHRIDLILLGEWCYHLAMFTMLFQGFGPKEDFSS